MAEVFLARDTASGALVAIKRILPHLAGDLSFVRMFLDEARIAAQIHHPNVVRVFELGKLESSIFLAMEFLEGSDVRRMMTEMAKKRAQMPFGVAARIAAEVARGLYFAHNSVGVDGRPLEVVHRDVSPQNVMVGFDGKVKLVDFGIARAGAFMEASKPGVIKGKFLYLSPEQVSQQPVDHRADIFSLGTLLYEMSVGRSPFHRPTGEAIIFAVGKEEAAPPELLRPDYPAALSEIVLRCLQKDRKKRYPDAAQIANALEDFILAEGLAGDARAVRDFLGLMMGTNEERTLIHVPPTPRRTPSPVAEDAQRHVSGVELVAVPVLGPMPPSLKRISSAAHLPVAPPPPPHELTPSMASLGLTQPAPLAGEERTAERTGGDVVTQPAPKGIPPASRTPRPSPDIPFEAVPEPPSQVTKPARGSRGSVPPRATAAAFAAEAPPDTEVGVAPRVRPPRPKASPAAGAGRLPPRPASPEFWGLSLETRAWGVVGAVLLLGALLAVFAWMGK